MSDGPLACSVRGCGLALVLDARTARCARGHAFDRAKSGYWNLLQPQDRRSLAAGDSKEVVQARLALEERGLGADLESAIAAFGVEARLSSASAVLDLGAGTGRHLAALASRFACAALGLDLSSRAPWARHPRR